MKTTAKKSEQCLNCSEPLQGENYCPHCGQKNDVRRLNAWHFITESLSNAIAFDGRLFTTLINLFSRPGKVPLDFIQGKRTRYMNPIRIYFLASILLLFLISLKDESKQIVKVKESPDAADTTEVTIPTDSAGTPSLNFDLNQLQEKPEKKNRFGGLLKNMSDFYETHPNLSTDEALDSLQKKPNFWNRFLYEQSIKIANFDTEEFNKYFLSKLFWILFLFIPVLGVLLKLLYVRRSFYYPEHLIFTFYTQAVFFLVFSLAIFTTPYLFLAFAVYLFLAMRHFYRQGYFKTFFKFCLLNILIVPVLILFGVLSMLVVFVMF